MSNVLEKYRNGEKALDAERRLMNDALAKFGGVESWVVAARPPGRLIFGLDLTQSREASLRQARIATAAMFDTVKALGRIEVKLIHYRGIGKCRESEWYSDPDILRRAMLKLSCEAGQTQIGDLLRLVLAQKEIPSGVVFVGDHCQENHAQLVALAQALGERSIPLFVFHECADHDPWSLMVIPLFKRMAEASGGVYVEFRPDSGAVLKELLSNVAALAANGVEGVEKLALPTTPEARQLQARLLLGSGGRKH